MGLAQQKRLYINSGPKETNWTLTENNDQQRARLDSTQPYKTRDFYTCGIINEALVLINALRYLWVRKVPDW